MATVRRAIAPNPGPYTGPGTNTWIVAEPPVAIVIDPGPDDDAHLAAIERTLGGLPIAAILVTHSHPDHLALAERLASRTSAHVARYPQLDDGDEVQAGRLTLRGLHTPGHAPDHLCFWMPDDRVAFTGDLVLGRGSTMITFPEGDVAGFLASLDRLAGLEPRILFPGHWDPVTEPAAKLADYRDHRLKRERQVVEELERGGGTPEAITHRVYAAEIGNDEALLRAAEMTLRAHLRKLVDEGRATESGGVFSIAG
jgi:hydroxyacylglutathione hydrolase